MCFFHIQLLYYIKDWEGQSTNLCNIDQFGTYTIERSYSITTNVRPSVCM